MTSATRSLRNRRPWYLVRCGLALVLGCTDSAPPSAVVEPIPSARLCALRDSPYVVELEGSQDRWKVRYPGAERMLETVGDGMAGLELHVPDSRQVTLVLHSTDYVYTLELPDLQLKEIAVPKLEFQIDFVTGSAARLELVGDHLCGGAIQELHGWLIVQPAEDLARWLSQQAEAAVERVR